jgi:hypothetical protein
MRTWKIFDAEFLVWKHGIGSLLNRNENIEKIIKRKGFIHFGSAATASVKR